MDRNVFCAMLVCVVVAAAPANGQVYKWVDQKGTVHFSNSPPKTPPAGAVEMRDSKPPPPVAEGQPRFPAEEKSSVPVTHPADEGEQPDSDYGDDWPLESGDGSVVVEPDESNIYDPDVIDAIRRQRLQDRLSAPPRAGSGAPASAAPRRGGRR